jgi:hypothetical protein
MPVKPHILLMALCPPKRSLLVTGKADCRYNCTDSFHPILSLMHVKKNLRIKAVPGL